MSGKWFQLACVCTFVLALGSTCPGASPILIGHAECDITTMPDTAVTSAAAVRLVVRRASVGGNVSAGLDALQGLDSKYDRSLWDFSDRGNPGWQAKVDDLDTFTAANTSSFDVFSMKFCYIDPAANWSYYRDHMLALETAYPAKKFVWWTIPILTSDDGQAAARDAFNQNVRSFCSANNKALFDIADIECHTPAGVKNVDGNGREAMVASYSSDGGHLNSTGGERVARAFWYLVARLAGWDGEVPVTMSAWEVD